MSNILNLGEAILKLEVDRSGFKSSIDGAKQDATSLQETLTKRAGTSPFSQYIAELRALDQALGSGAVKADQYAQGLERAFQRMQRSIGGSRESAEQLTRSIASDTPLNPIQRRDNSRREVDRLWSEDTITTDEAIARKRQINEQYREEMANLPATVKAAAAAEEEFARRMAYAEPIIERSKTALQSYLEELSKLRAARAIGDITPEEFRSEAGRARGQFQETDAGFIERTRQAAQDAAAAEAEFAAQANFATRAIQDGQTPLERREEALRRIREARSYAADDPRHLNAEQATRASQQAFDEFRRTDPGERSRAAEEKADALAKAQAAATAAKAAQDRLNASRESANALDQKGAQVSMQFASAQERHNSRMIEYEHLLQRNKISQDVFNRAQKESLDIQRMEAMSGRGTGGRVGNSLMMQGSYALQDFATVASMKGMGIGDAFRAASNNIGMMAMTIGGPSGSIVAALATLASVAPGLWEKFGAGADDAKERVAAAVKAIRDEFRKISENYGEGAEQRGTTRRNARLDDPAEMIAESEKLEADRLEARREQAEKGPALKKLEDDIAKYEQQESDVKAGFRDKRTTTPEEYEAKKEERDRLRDEMADARRREEFSARERRRVEDALPGAEDRERLRLIAKEQRDRKEDRDGFREIGTTEDSEQEIKRQAEAAVKSWNKSEELAMQREIEKSRPDGGRKDVLARFDQKIEEEQGQQRRANANIDFLQARQGGLFGGGAFDRMRDEELSFMDRQKKNREAIDPRMERAREVKDQYEEDVSVIRRNRAPGADQAAAIEEAKQGAIARLAKIRGEDKEGKKGSFSFADPESFYKSIQTGLKADDGNKAQKDSVVEQKETNKKLDAMTSAIKEMNTGLL